MTADIAIVDATVVTMDAAGTVLHGATVLVDGATITHVGLRPDRAVDARRTIDARGALVVPGLVNAHTHLAMTMFRGLADDLDLERFLSRLLPAEGALLSAETVAAGTTLAIAECFRAGITTALDMYFFPEASTAVADATGFDLRHGPVFVELDGPDGRPFAERLAWAGELLAATDPTRRWVCPHSTYLLDEDQLTAVGTLADEHGARVHVHACETVAELALVRDRHARSPIEVLRDTGLLGSGTVLGHGVHLTDDDIALVAAAGATVAHCPASNQKLASGFARVPELLAAGVPVALGTDGAASANDLDLWLAMRLAAYPLAARTGVGTVGATRHPRAWPRRAAPGPPAPRGSVRSRSGPVPTSSCSTRRHRRSPRRTTRSRRSSTRRRAPTSAGSSPAAASCVDDRELTTIDVEAAIASRARPRTADPRGDRGMNAHDAREALHAACLQMVADGLVIGSAGNISVRIDEHRFVVTAAGVPYRRLDPRRPPRRRCPHRRVGRSPATHERDRAAPRGASARCPTSGRSSTRTPATPQRSPSPASTCRSSATSRWRPAPSASSSPSTPHPVPPTSAPRRWPRSPASPAAAPCCSPTTASSPSPRRWTRRTTVAQAVEWTAEICHLARTLVAAGAGETVLDRDVQAAIARNYGVTIVGED